MASLSHSWRFFLRAGAIVLTAAAAGLAFAAWQAIRVPMDAPVPRMYRAETDLEALAKALSYYQEDHGEAPPPGDAGLRMATDHLSKLAGYFPEGPPLDPWGRPYRYEERNGAKLLRSLGRDGEPGTDDDIFHGMAAQPWRAHYRTLQRESRP